jgi:hypothetical protein
MLFLACEIVCAYHDDLLSPIVPHPDFYHQEAVLAEAEIQRQNEEAESESEEYVTSDEDMNYSDWFYK